MTSMFRLSMAVACALGLMCMIGGAAPNAMANDRCLYDGATFSDGAISCQDGVRYKCDDGDWKSKHEACTVGQVIERRDTVEVPSTEERTVIKKKSEIERTD
jgi:hypothetical protein